MCDESFGEQFTDTEKEALGIAEHTWRWVFADMGNVEQLNPRDPHGEVEDVLTKAFNLKLERAQVVSEFALNNVLGSSSKL